MWKLSVWNSSPQKFALEQRFHLMFNLLCQEQICSNVVTNVGALCFDLPLTSVVLRHIQKNKLQTTESEVLKINGFSLVSSHLWQNFSKRCQKHFENGMPATCAQESETRRNKAFPLTWEIETQKMPFYVTFLFVQKRKILLPGEGVIVLCACKYEANENWKPNDGGTTSQVFSHIHQQSNFVFVLYWFERVLGIPAGKKEKTFVHRNQKSTPTANLSPHICCSPPGGQTLLWFGLLWFGSLWFGSLWFGSLFVNVLTFFTQYSQLGNSFGTHPNGTNLTNWNFYILFCNNMHISTKRIAQYPFLNFLWKMPF